MQRDRSVALRNGLWLGWIALSACIIFGHRWGYFRAPLWLLLGVCAVTIVCVMRFWWRDRD